MWFSAIKLAVSAGSKIYANKQRTKMAMSDAQLMHASRMAEGKEAYQGKIIRIQTIRLEGRIYFAFTFGPIVMLGWSVWSDNPVHMDKMELFFVHFGNLPLWYQTIFVGVLRAVYGLKATHLIKNK